VVLPGPFAGNSAVVCDLIHREQVTIALGVPTVWLGMLDHLQQGGQPLPADLRIIVGGAACPAAVFDAFGANDVEVQHAWGMTEMSPLGTFNAPSGKAAGLAPADERQRKLKQGRALFGVEMKIVDDADQELAWDGVSSGRLKVRGPWVCSGYYLPDEGVQSHDVQGWFETGDVATIDADGYMHITDRTKDLIKSGGEWISSIVLENLAQGHPAVAEAAVIGMPHPKWSERPLLVVVPKAGQQLDRTELLAWYEGKVAKWWIPDEVAFVAELPHTATGKVSKVRLRAQFATPDSGSPAKT
jgi:fatty-acyl-CoA synthase